MVAPERPVNEKQLVAVVNKTQLVLVVENAQFFVVMGNAQSVEVVANAQLSVDAVQNIAAVVAIVHIVTVGQVASDFERVGNEAGTLLAVDMAFDAGLMCIPSTDSSSETQNEKQSRQLTQTLHFLHLIKKSALYSFTITEFTSIITTKHLPRLIGIPKT